MSYYSVEYIENKRAYLHLLEISYISGTSQIGGARKVVVKGLEDGYPDQILKKIINTIKKFGIPQYIKKWKRYQMKNRYSSIEKFNIDLKRLVASYHHHSFINYKNGFVVTPEDKKRWKKYMKKRKKIKITKLPRKMPDFEFKNGIGKIVIYHFFLEYEGNEPNSQSIKDQEKQVQLIQSHLKKWKKQKQKIKGLIIDFRQHVGGSVIHLYEAFADIFEGATIYGWKNSQAKKSDKIWINVENEKVIYNQKYLGNDLNWDVPIAILIGDNTSSSGEFGSIMFYGRPNTRFFGKKSSGDLSGNNTISADDDYMLILTESLVNTPDLTFHNSEQIEPDVVTDTPIKLARNWILKYNV
jgi:Peptidase family S41